MLEVFFEIITIKSSIFREDLYLKMEFIDVHICTHTYTNACILYTILSWLYLEYEYNIMCCPFL